MNGVTDNFWCKIFLGQNNLGKKIWVKNNFGSKKGNFCGFISNVCTKLTGIPKPSKFRSFGLVSVSHVSSSKNCHVIT